MRVETGMMKRIGTRRYRVKIFVLIALVTTAIKSYAAAPPSTAHVGTLPRTAAVDFELQRLMERIQRFYSEGKHAEAYAVGQQLLSLERKASIGISQELAAINWLAAISENATDWPHAESFRQEMLASSTNHFGENHWQTVDARLALEDVRRQRSFTAAELAQLRQANIDLARAVELSNQGKFVEAVPLAQRTLKFRDGVWGSTHHRTAGVRSWLGLLFVDMGEFDQAEPLLAETLSIHKKSLGTKHPKYAMSLNNLAGRYQQRADYSQAESLFIEAHEIFKETLGKGHPDYALSLNNLAALYQDLGDYARAEPFYIENRAIIKTIHGTKHSEYATSLNNLACLYEELGDYSRAVPLFVEARAIRKEVLGRNHPKYATSLHNLAGLYQNMGDLVNAEPLYIEARDIVAETHGTKHLNYARSLNSLASLYEQLEDYARAEPLYVEARAIRKEVLGIKHPDYAASLNNLAGLYESMGDYKRAETLYVEALVINRENYSSTHPKYAVSLNNLAWLYANQEDSDRAEPLYREVLGISRASLDATAVFQSERQQLGMGQSLRYQLDAYVSLGTNSGKFARNIFSQILAWKGATLVRQRGMRLAASDPAVKDLFLELQTTATRLAALSNAPPVTDEDKATWKSRLAALTTEKELLEAKLSGKSEVFRNAIKKVALEDFLVALPPDTVLIDYLEYNRFVLPKPEGKKAKWERQLVAFVVRRGEKEEDQVRLIPLGPVAPIAEAIDAWRKNFGIGDANAAAGKTLRAAVWQPLVQHLGDADTILVSTDGELGRLPLSALPGKAPGTYLLEDHRLALVPVTQLLPTLLSGEAKRKTTSDLLLVGNVDYGADTAAKPETAIAKVRTTQSRSAVRSGSNPKWNQLPETNTEIATIRNKLTEIAGKRGLLKPRVEELKEAGATVAEFLRLAPDCRDLHLATHGFFTPPEMKSAERIATPNIKSIESTPFTARETQVVGYSPGLMSGVVFAGANNPPQVDREDGILTSEEISCMPLDGVRLVVLSACETGLGATAGGEGLLGVQRAFQVSGAGTTIATLWEVDDLVTRILMERFYENLWERKLSRLDALREAQLFVLKNPDKLQGGALSESEARGKVRGATLVETDDTSMLKTSPQYWAAFILSGDWR